jgi:multidrug resistance efflux pump
LANKDEKVLMTNLYKNNFTMYVKRIEEIDVRIAKATKELNRNKQLFEQELIAEKDFDDLGFQLEKVQKEKQTIIYNQKAKWENDLVNYTTELKNMRSNYEQLSKQKEDYCMKTPVNGTIEEFRGIYKGSTVQAGQSIAVISPDSEIIAEVYISAKDVGYLNNDIPVNIQVDAFNYNEWGVLEGSVSDVSNDFMLVENIPVFKVKCKLNQPYLQLKNGVKGNLKKGMTINVRFLIAKRSLFQLLYQKTDDWLNPSRNLTTR